MKSTWSTRADLDWLKTRFEGMSRHIRVDKVYLETHRDTIVAEEATIEQAKQFSAQVGKPVFDTELGCVCRANPFDITLEEHMRAGIG